MKAGNGTHDEQARLKLPIAQGDMLIPGNMSQLIQMIKKSFSPVSEVLIQRSGQDPEFVLIPDVARNGEGPQSLALWINTVITTRYMVPT